MTQRIHPTANIWGDFCIGPDTSIGAFCDISAPIGAACKVQAHVSIPPGWVIGDRVFIGPGARFANDRKPDLSGQFEPLNGYVGDDAVIGMGALIGAGVRVGARAIIGMGAVVLQDVPEGETWVGNPARKVEKE